MISAHRRVTSTLAIVVLILIVGCASGPQYVPRTLKGQSAEQLSQLNIDIRTKDVRIDGERVSGTTVFLAAGAHSIEYKVYGESEKWNELAESMRQKGFTERSDGTFVQREGGLTRTAKPLGVSRYDWNARSKNVTFEAGQTYSLSRLE